MWKFPLTPVSSRPPNRDIETDVEDGRFRRDLYFASMSSASTLPAPASARQRHLASCPAFHRELASATGQGVTGISARAAERFARLTHAGKCANAAEAHTSALWRSTSTKSSWWQTCPERFAPPGVRRFFVRRPDSSRAPAVTYQLEVDETIHLAGCWRLEVRPQDQWLRQLFGRFETETRNHVPAKLR